MGWRVEVYPSITIYISPAPDLIKYILINGKLIKYTGEYPPNNIVDEIDVSGTYKSGPYSEDYGNYQAMTFVKDSNQLVFEYNDDGIHTLDYTYSVSDDGNGNTIISTGFGIDYKFIPIYDENKNVINKVLVSDGNGGVITTNGTTGLIQWSYPTTTLYLKGNSTQTITINNDGTMCFSETENQKWFYYIDSTDLDMENRVYPNIYTARGNFQIITPLGDLAGTHIDNGNCMYINNVNGPNDG